MTLFDTVIAFFHLNFHLYIGNVELKNTLYTSTIFGLSYNFLEGVFQHFCLDNSSSTGVS